MKTLILSYLAIATSIFGQNSKPEEKKIQELFYVTMGSAIPMKHNDYYTRQERAMVSIGIGVRTFFECGFGMDVGSTFYHHPRFHTAEGSIIWLYKPDFLEGIYAGFGGTVQKELDVYCNRLLSVTYKGVIGYQVPSETDKSSFFDIGFDRFQVLTIRSGLLF